MRKIVPFLSLKFNDENYRHLWMLTRFKSSKVITLKQSKLSKQGKLSRLVLTEWWNHRNLIYIECSLGVYILAANPMAL